MSHADSERQVFHGIAVFGAAPAQAIGALIFGCSTSSYSLSTQAKIVKTEWARHANLQRRTLPNASGKAVSVLVISDVQQLDLLLECALRRAALSSGLVDFEARYGRRIRDAFNAVAERGVVKVNACAGPSNAGVHTVLRTGAAGSADRHEDLPGPSSAGRGAAGRNAGAGPSTAGPSNYGQPAHRDAAHGDMVARTSGSDADADAVADNGAYNVSDGEPSGATTDASTDATSDSVISSGDDDGRDAAGVNAPVHVQDLPAGAAMHHTGAYGAPDGALAVDGQNDGTRRRRSARLQALPNVIQRNGAAVQAAAGGTARRRRRAQPVQHEEECSPPEDRSPAGLWQLSWTGGSRNTYSIAEWLAKWKRKTTLLRFDGLLSCALCGFSAFAIDCSMFSAVPTPPGPGAQLPPYAFMMPGCGGTMVEDDRWLVCKQCTGTGKSALPVTASARLHHLPHLTRNYIGTVLNLDPFYQMQLSLVDVGVGFTSSTIGHYIPRFGRPHALATALVTSHGSQQERLAMLPQEFGDLLSWSIDNNPLYASYLSVVERKTPASELPFLPPHTVEEIVRAARDRGPLQETADLAAARGRIRSHIAAVVPLPPLIPVRASHAPASFTVGTLETRQGRQLLDAAVAANGRALALGGGGAAAGASNTAAADTVDGEAGSGDRDAEGPNADGQADGRVTDFSDNDADDDDDDDADGRQRRDGANGLSMEQCVFPYLFPDGSGAFGESDWTLAKYTRYRALSLLSPWTLTKPYLPLLHAHNLSMTMQSPGLKGVLERSVVSHLEAHPDATDQEVVRHVLKHSLPPTMPCTPAWHRKHLQDLECMVDRWGMPSLFLTLTADEVSSTRWEEVDTLDSCLQNFVYDMSWRDAAPEAAYLFVKRVQAFMTNVLRGGKGGKRAGPLGRIVEYMVRFEAQGRASLHAHIVLWVHPEDLQRVQSEIVGCVPAAYTGDASDPRCPISDEYWVRPADPHQAALLTHVLAKQVHRCREDGCCRAGPCQYGFPWPPHATAKPALDPRTLRYMYYRPTWAHRNVSPYHPVVALLWGAHTNIQVINSSSWSYYVLKYALKCEPSGPLSLNNMSNVIMGLQPQPPAGDGDEMEAAGGTSGPDVERATSMAQILSAYVTTRAVDPCLAFMGCAGISTVDRSSSVEVIDSQPPFGRTRVVLKNSRLSVPPVDIYRLRPAALEQETFCDFYLNYRLLPSSERVPRTLPADSYVGTTNDGGSMKVFRVDAPRLVRFSDCSPAHDPEGYFYNMLLRRVPFRLEAELLSAANETSTYYEECLLRGFVSSEEDLQDHLDEYASYHLYDSRRAARMLAELLTHYHPDEAVDAAFGGADGNRSDDEDTGGPDPVAANPGAAAAAGAAAEEAADAAAPIAAAPAAAAGTAARPLAAGMTPGGRPQLRAAAAAAAATATGAAAAPAAPATAAAPPSDTLPGGVTEPAQGAAGIAVDDIVCDVCGRKEPATSILYCDRYPQCCAGRHLGCCVPRLWQVPPEDVPWYCCPEHDPAWQPPGAAAATAAPAAAAAAPLAGPPARIPAPQQQQQKHRQEQQRDQLQQRKGRRRRPRQRWTARPRRGQQGGGGDPGGAAREATPEPPPPLLHRQRQPAEPLRRPTVHPGGGAATVGAGRRPSARKLAAMRQALLDEFAELDAVDCRAGQEAAVDAIKAMPAGLVVLTGGPGSGKTFATKKLTRALRSGGRGVLLTASTGAAATRLSRYAFTNHKAFGLRRSGAMQAWRPTDPRAEALRNNDVFIMDEFSMTTSTQLLHVLLRIAEANRLVGPEEVLRSKLIVLVGDHAQLPPVCRCRRTRAPLVPRVVRTNGHDSDDDTDDEAECAADICAACHISSNPYWPRAIKHILPASVRQENDPPFAAFLDIIRVRVPTQAEIDAVFGTPTAPACAGYVEPARVAATATADTTVLCTHVRDALRINSAVLHRLSSEGLVGPVHATPITHTVTDANAFRALDGAWLRKPKFRKMEYVAVGAKVILTENVDVAAGLANGASAVVTEVHQLPCGEVSAITVQLDSNGATEKLGRSVEHSVVENRVWYHKKTFPLALGYAITAHRSQGATLAGRTVVLARDVFAPGQLYVMLSRVTERRHIMLAGRLTPNMFRPVIVPGLVLVAATAPALAAAAPTPPAEFTPAAAPKRRRVAFEYDANRPDLMAE